MIIDQKIMKRFNVTMILSLSLSAVLISLLYISNLFLSINDSIRFMQERFIPYTIFAIILSFAVSVLAAIIRYNKLYLYKDIESRTDISELDNIETRINKRIDTLFQDKTINQTEYEKIFRNFVSENLDDDLLLSIDNALQERISKQGKSLRVIRFLDGVTSELKLRLEGPAGRAETQAKWARWGAYTLVIIGLSVAIYRIYILENVTESLNDLYKAAGDRSIWPFVFANSAPWLGLIFLIEFTALLFMRFSTHASIQQRYFTEGYTELKDRYAALRTIIEYGTDEQIVVSARSMIVYGQRQMTETNDAETINASSRLVASLTGLIKETSAKASTN